MFLRMGFAIMRKGEPMSDWFGILLTILSIFIGGFALGYKCGKEIGND